MKKYINYFTAGSKVIYDKTTDYLSYYSWYKNSVPNDKSLNNNDVLEDYNHLLSIELYQKENITNRIYPHSSYYDVYTVFFSQPTKIIDGLYLGSAFNAASHETLKRLNIKVIINATSEISEYFPNDFIYVRYSLYDNNKHTIKQYLDEAYNVIKSHYDTLKENENILIHCFIGASRSASIVIYYLMKTMKHADGAPFNFDDALAYVRAKRPIVNPTFRLTKDLASSFINNKIAE